MNVLQRQLVVTLVLWATGVWATGQVSFGLRKLAYSTNQFGLDMMRALDRDDPSAALCPVCISSSLAMMLVGAQGTMANSLKHALYLYGMQPNEIHGAYFDMMNHLGVNVPSQHPHHPSFGHVHGGPNAVYGRRAGVYSGASVSTSPLMSLAEITRSTITTIFYCKDTTRQLFIPLDFHYNGDETRSHINAIVEKQSAGNIKNILQTSAPSQYTQLLLLSALSFRGTLDLDLLPVHQPIPAMQPVAPPASPPLYHPTLGGLSGQPIDPFSDSSKQVWLQSTSARIRHGFHWYLNCTTVEMPFKGGLITLVMMMPHDPSGLETLMTKLSAQVLTDVIGSLEVKRVNIRMPRLQVDKGLTNLTWTLSNLGLADLFKPGYSQLYDVSDYKWLSVSEVVHKTVLDIKEQSASSPTPFLPVASTSGAMGVENTPPGNGNPIKHLMYNQQKPPLSHGHGQNTFYTMNSINGSPSPLNVHNQNGAEKQNGLTVNFDKPFIYFVFDNVSGLVLVMGKVGMGHPASNYRLPGVQTH
ncbi:Leukocyte elastase inhibitor [Halotydeus destructor]|nr:Leukocyte elastase inhibitor [Halotydeus destructor]